MSRTKQLEFEGRDLHEALHAAAAALGIAEPDLDYEIVEQGRRGLFGIGAKSVRIRVMPPIVPPTAAGPAPRRSAPVASEDAEATEDPGIPVTPADAARVESTTAEIVRHIGFDLEVRARAEGGRVLVEFGGPDRDALLAKDSELLSALQFVLNRMSRRTWPGVARIELECDGGPSRRDEDVVALVEDVARQVARTGKPKRLPPMNAYERRIVHITVRKHRGLASRSEGEGHLKQVRIFRQGTRRG